MTTFFYYVKDDSQKEAINKASAGDILEAIELFSKQKQLPTSKFLTIYAVDAEEK